MSYEFCFLIVIATHTSYILQVFLGGRVTKMLRKVITKANQIVCGRKFNIILGNEYKSVKIW